MTRNSNRPNHGTADLFIRLLHTEANMLVLSRTVDETIVLTLPDGRRIEILVVDIRRNFVINKVRLGIEAPLDVTIHRGEVQDAIDRETSA